MFGIALRELHSLFLSPLAWSILAVTQFILGYVFLSNLEVFLQIQPKLPHIPNAPGFSELVASSLFGTAAIVLLLISPLLTMRLIAEERRNHTLPLLLSAPISSTRVVLGKYLGLMGFFLVLLLLLALMPLSLAWGGPLDFGLLAAGLLALLLLVAAFGAIGLFMSTLAGQPAIAAVGAFGVLLLLWIVDWAGERAETGVLSYLSMLNHYEALLRGLFSSADVVYYLLIVAVFLLLAIRRLDAERLG